MSRKPARDKAWKYDVGDLTAYERKDRGRAIWTRIRERDTKKYIEIKALCGPVRDDDGNIDPEKENAARQAATERWKQYSAGEHPQPTSKKLTLKRAVQLVLHPKEGKYAGESDWQNNVERYLKICIEVLGDIPIEDIKHSHYRKVWRWLAAEHVKDSEQYGARTAEMVCGALRTAMNWLGQEELVEPYTALPAKGWKTQMLAEWVKLTGKPISDPKKPRYTKAEYAKLWAALPKADPRVRLAVEIGAELRLGQVVERTRRSDVVPHGIHEIGMVIVHGSGKKFGEDVVLNDEQRAGLVEAITTGFLSECERAYKAGEIPDYLLIAGGHLLGEKSGNPKAQPKNALMTIQKRAMQGYWRELEELADVQHMDGRGWYGVRRRASDDSEDETSDERVLNKMGGWKNSQTRRRYQDAGRTDIAEKAADVRSKIRPRKRPESGESVPPKSTMN